MVITPSTEKEKKSRLSLTRGQFLSFAWVGTIALVVGEAIFALAKYIQPVSTGGFGGVVFAGNVGDFEVDSVTYILSGRFYLVRNADGLLALWQKCTHLGCAVPWAANEDQFHCPCHGSLYSENGVVQGGPAPRPLDRFPIEIRGDEIWVDTSKPIQRTSYEPSQATPV
jgi:cytochrome b6-f complex iron-sulfur subunit